MHADECILQFDMLSISQLSFVTLAINTFLFSIAMADAVDFSHCNQLLKNASADTIAFQNGTPVPVAIRSGLVSGVEQTANGPSVTTALNEGAHGSVGLSHSVHEGMFWVPSFSLAQSSSDSYVFRSKDVYKSIESTEVLFRVQNNVCLPIRGTQGGKELFNTELCREISQFLKKNLDALKCQCGDEASFNTLSALVSKMGPPAKNGFKFDAELLDYKNIDTSNFHNKSGSSSDSPKVLPDVSGVGHASSFSRGQIPLLLAKRIIDECESYPGVAEGATDEIAWTESPAASKVGKTRNSKVSR